LCKLFFEDKSCKNINGRGLGDCPTREKKMKKRETDNKGAMQPAPKVLVSWGGLNSY